MANTMSGFPPSFTTPMDSMVLSSMGFPFGWNWNSVVSEKPINLTQSVPSSSVVPFPCDNNVSRALPFLGVVIPL